MEEKNGKQTPVKVGLGSEGDKQSDFEYTVSFMLSQGTHIASVNEGGKDNTGLFEDKYEVITRKHGEMLYDWANSGDGEPVIIKGPGEETPEEDIKSVKKQIIDRCNALGGTSNANLMATLKSYVSSGNPNAIKDLGIAKELLETLNRMN